MEWPSSPLTCGTRHGQKWSKTCPCFQTLSLELTTVYSHQSAGQYDSVDSVWIWKMLKSSAEYGTILGRVFGPISQPWCERPHNTSIQVLHISCCSVRKNLQSSCNHCSCSELHHLTYQDLCWWSSELRCCLGVLCFVS